MTVQLKNNRNRWRPRLCILAAMLSSIAGWSQPAAAVDDVLLQTVDGAIVTGIVNDNTFVASLGHRVFRQQFLSNFRSANPGFVSLATGDVSMPPGAQGFPSNHDVSFDLLPMTIETVSSNLFYWDGTDLGGDGLDLSDVRFVIPPVVSWEVFDASFNAFAADGSDQLVSGGLIDQTSSDIDPFDGVDTGSIHRHLVLQLNDNDGNSGTSPAQGVYMISWQARSEGFETSEPFFFVLRTSAMSNTVRDLAAQWAEANIEMLTSPPGLPGDYNDDGSVDAADYVFWRATFGQIGENLPADGDYSGEIDAGDYTVWTENFGATDGPGAGSALAAVPEPAAWLLFVLGSAPIVALAGRRRFRHFGSQFARDGLYSMGTRA